MKLSDLKSIYDIRDLAHNGMLSTLLLSDEAEYFIDRLFLSSLDKYRMVSDVLMPFKSDLDPVDRSPVIYRLFDGSIRSSVEYREMLCLWKYVLTEAVKRDTLDTVRYLLEESFYKDVLTSSQKIDLMKKGSLSIEMMDYIIVEVLSRLDPTELKEALFDVVFDVVLRDRDDILGYLYERSKFKNLITEDTLRTILSKLTVDAMRKHNETVLIPYYCIERIALYGVEISTDVVELMEGSTSLVFKSLKNKPKEYLRGFTNFVKYIWEQCEYLDKSNIKFLLSERLVKEVGLEGKKYTYEEMVMVLNNLK